MKKQKIIIILILLGSSLSLTAWEAVAQRKVVIVEKPRKTVVVKKTPKTRVVYTRATPRVKVVRTVPSASVIITHRNINYYYHTGIYYRYSAGNYIMVAPPPGIKVSTLPFGYRKIYMGPRVYFYFGGIFYVKNESVDEYKVVEAPEGAIVYGLPEETGTVLIEDSIYYAYNNTLYQKIETAEGEAYEVRGQL